VGVATRLLLGLTTSTQSRNYHPSFKLREHPHHLPHRGPDGVVRLVVLDLPLIARDHPTAVLPYLS
jgi:hypothetical protein